MNENTSDNVNWLVRYARESGQGQQALARYAVTVSLLSEWEMNPDAGFMRLWSAIVKEGTHDT